MTQTIGRVDNPVSFSYHQISYTHYWMVGCSILIHKFLLFCLFSLPAVLQCFTTDTVTIIRHRTGTRVEKSGYLGGNTSPRDIQNLQYY